jgi:hypothetical protein
MHRRTFLGFDLLIFISATITCHVEWSTNLASWLGIGVIETLDLDPPTDPAYPLIKSRVSKGPDPVKFLRQRIVK